MSLETIDLGPNPLNLPPFFGTIATLVFDFSLDVLDQKSKNLHAFFQ